MSDERDDDRFDDLGDPTWNASGIVFDEAAVESVFIEEGPTIEGTFVTVDLADLPAHVSVQTTEFWTVTVEDSVEENAPVVFVPPGVTGGDFSAIEIDVTSTTVSVSFDQGGGAAPISIEKPLRIGDHITFTHAMAAPMSYSRCAHGVSPLGQHCFIEATDIT